MTLKAANGNISIHMPEALQGSATHTSPESHSSSERLGDQRQSIFEKTDGQLLRMREECEHLGKLFADSEPETVAIMMTGLDRFTDGFLKLTRLIESAVLKTDMDSKVIYIE